MGLFRWTARYRNTVTGMEWTVTAFRSVASYSDVFTVVDNWNDFYMGVCSAHVIPLDLRVSDTALYRDVKVYPTSAFTTQIGQTAGAAVPDANVLLVQGMGGATGGRSQWFLHGLTEQLRLIDDLWNITTAPMVAFEGNCGLTFLQYRPVASPVKALPVVNPPALFGSGVLFNPRIHVRRVGRPFSNNGQMRAYRRS